MSGDVVNEEWNEDFRMLQTSFIYLCDELRAHIGKQNIRFRKAVSIEKKVAVTLYYIADVNRMRKIENAFGLAKSTISKIRGHPGDIYNLLLLALLMLKQMC